MSARARGPPRRERLAREDHRLRDDALARDALLDGGRGRDSPRGVVAGSSHAAAAPSARAVAAARRVVARHARACASAMGGSASATSGARAPRPRAPELHHLCELAQRRGRVALRAAAAAVNAVVGRGAQHRVGLGVRHARRAAHARAAHDDVVLDERRRRRRARLSRARRAPASSAAARPPSARGAPPPPPAASESCSPRPPGNIAHVPVGPYALAPRRAARALERRAARHKGRDVGYVHPHAPRRRRAAGRRAAAERLERDAVVDLARALAVDRVHGEAARE